MKKLALALGALAFAACVALAQDSKKEGSPLNTTATADTSTAATSSTVAPGGVKWRASLEDAIVAARESKKPILHFQLLGKLDQEFC